jgi:hypothetical protein
LSVTCGRLMVFSGTFTNKTDHDDITELLLKVALNVKALTHINPYLPESLHFSMMCEFKLSIYRTFTLIRALWWLLHCIYVLCFCMFVLRLINPYSMIFLMTTHLWLPADLKVHKRNVYRLEIKSNRLSIRNK